MNIKTGTSKKVFVGKSRVYKWIKNASPLDEKEIYKAAKEEGLEEFFVKTSGIGCLEIQNKVDCVLNEFISESRPKIKYGAFRETYKEMGFEEFLYIGDVCVLYHLINTHGLSKTLDFAAFCKRKNLNDLYFYNAGFEKGVLKFFDFGGTAEYLGE